MGFTHSEGGSGAGLLMLLLVLFSGTASLPQGAEGAGAVNMNIDIPLGAGQLSDLPTMFLSSKIDSVTATLHYPAPFAEQQLGTLFPALTFTYLNNISLVIGNIQAVPSSYNTIMWDFNVGGILHSYGHISRVTLQFDSSEAYTAAMVNLNLLAPDNDWFTSVSMSPVDEPADTSASITPAIAALVAMVALQLALLIAVVVIGGCLYRKHASTTKETNAASPDNYFLLHSQQQSPRDSAAAYNAPPSRPPPTNINGQ